MRQVPTFDDVSFGLRRLVEAGLIYVSDTAGGPQIQPTTEALALQGRVSTTRLGEEVAALRQSLGIDPVSGNDEDRSLGRLPGLTRETWDAAVQEHNETLRRLSEPWIQAAQDLIRRQQRP